MKEYLPILGTYLLVINLLAFLMMGADKFFARKGMRRIRERTLFLPVLLGGGVGGILGMKLFRHKTLHWQFRFGFPAILLLELAGAGWLVWYFVIK